jgi:SAM-dependent methyltransferase
MTASGHARRWTASHTDVGPTADEVAFALRAGVVPDDRVFDWLLPERERERAWMFWTPVRVAVEFAGWLDRYEARSVLDLGSGVGKFAVIAALCSKASVLGVEQRASLIEVARDLVERFALSDRVRFEQGAFGAVELPAVDAYYLFNPFGENLFSNGEQIDNTVELSFERYRRDCRAMTALLAASPRGTLLCTYNGFGGTLPPTFRLVRVGQGHPCPLRLWRKELDRASGPFLSEEALAELVLR